MKACKKCWKIKGLEEFYKCKTTLDKKRGECRECHGKWAKKRLQIPEVKALAKIYRKEHNQTPEVKARMKAYLKEYNQIPEIKTRLREQKNGWQKERCANDPLYRFARNMRRRINLGLKGQSKSKRTEWYLSCTFGEAWAYLIPKFRFPMTRENYGKVWHVDHIRPICSFDLSEPEQVKACFHYTNLQPLFVEENLVKGGRF
jgi:hypothetical protein